MNLKAAARQLEVHYQTAYKWVRSGELTAVRVSGRYEVSESAIERFLAGRRAVASTAEVPPPSRPGCELSREDVLEELEAMAADPIVTASAVQNLAARRGVDVLGDLCLVVRMDSDGRRVQVAVDHPEPDRAAFVAAALETRGGQRTYGSGSMAEKAYETGKAIRIPHIPQDQLRESIDPELLQYLPSYSICSLLSAPIAAGPYAMGFVAFVRDTPAHPYTAADEEFAVRFGIRIGSLFETERQIKAAWQLRRVASDAVRAQIATCSRPEPPTADELQQMLQDHPTTMALPLAVLDAHCRIVTVNDTFAKTTGYPLSAVTGKPVESFTHPDTVADERVSFERLLSGEVDYLDVHGRKLLADGTHLDYASHRVAVRRPDETLHCIISVLRPLHTRLEHSDQARPTITN